MKKLFCLVALLAMLTAPPVVYAQQQPSAQSVARQQLNTLSRKLNLNPAQQKTLTPVFDKHWSAMEEAETKARGHLRSLLTKEQTKKLDDMLKAHQAPGDLRKTLSLTPQQISKHDTYMKQVSSHMNAEQQHFLDSINKTLDAKQKTQFATLVQPQRHTAPPPGPQGSPPAKK